MKVGRLTVLIIVSIVLICWVMFRGFVRESAHSRAVDPGELLQVQPGFECGQRNSSIEVFGDSFRDEVVPPGDSSYARKRMTIQGMVIDVEGSPVQGARLFVLESDSAWCVSGVDGQFSVEMLELPKEVMLQITAKGYVQEYVSSYPGRYVNVILKRALRISGKLFKEDLVGQRTPLVQHEIRYAIYGKLYSSVITGKDGEFEIPVRPHQVELVVIPLRSRGEWREKIAVRSESLERDIIVPPASASIEVYVTGYESGQPLGGASVASFGRVLGETSADGLLEFSAAPGLTYEVSAEAPGFLTRWEEVLIESSAQIRLKLPLVLPGGVHGTVVDEHDLPVSQALVSLRVDCPKPISSMSQVPYRGVEGLRTGATVFTDEQGAFRFDGIGSRYNEWITSVHVSHPEYVAFVSNRLAVRPGDLLRFSTIVLDKGTRVTGSVSSQQGDRNAVVFIEEFPGTRVHTADSGAYCMVGIAPGAWTLVSYLEKYPQLIRRIPIQVSDRGLSDLNVEFEYSLERISGMVSSTAGLPVAGVPIECIAATLERKPVTYRTVSDLDGRYAFEVPSGLGSGAVEYSLRLFRWLGDREFESFFPPWREDFTVSSSRTITLEVRKSGSDHDLGRWFDVIWRPGKIDHSQLTQFICMDRSSRGGGLIGVIVPSGEGWIEVSIPGYGRRYIELDSSNPDLGVVEVDQDNG